MKPLSDSVVQRFAQTNRLKTKIDADGTLVIPGKLGHIYQYDENRLSVMVMPANSRVRQWNVTRRMLANLGFSIMQNGDCEGAAAFSPGDQEHARAAVRAAGIKRKRQLSPTQVNRQLAWLRASAGRAL
jgi:hypothetical protein